MNRQFSQVSRHRTKSNESHDSEDDEVIRSEVQDTAIFKNIQKLLKLAPHLNPNFSKKLTPEANSSNLEEISDEDSLSELDGGISSEDEVHSKSSRNKQLSKLLPPDPKVQKKLKRHLIDSSLKESKMEIPDSQTSEKSRKQRLEASNSQKSRSLSAASTSKREHSEVRAAENAKRSNSLMEKARSKLAAAKFRFLNEKLYTESGREAFQYFQENTEEFEDYHLGYGLQVSKWPLNPVDEIIADLQKIKKNVVIVDLGCGDAKIARTLTNRVVHSFDLVAMHECVTACDISKVPLPDGSVDVAVFCLSLMGINLIDYLREAHRILKLGGILKIAEVESRVENLDLFIKSLNGLGFILEKKNTKHKLFVFLELKKGKRAKATKAPTTIKLRPCLYKKR